MQSTDDERSKTAKKQNKTKKLSPAKPQSKLHSFAYILKRKQSEILRIEEIPLQKHISIKASNNVQNLGSLVIVVCVIFILLNNKYFNRSQD